MTEERIKNSLQGLQLQGLKPHHCLNIIRSKSEGIIRYNAALGQIDHQNVKKISSIIQNQVRASVFLSKRLPSKILYEEREKGGLGLSFPETIATLAAANSILHCLNSNIPELASPLLEQIRSNKGSFHETIKYLGNIGFQLKQA